MAQEKQWRIFAAAAAISLVFGLLTIALREPSAEAAPDPRPQIDANMTEPCRSRTVCLQSIEALLRESNRIEHAQMCLQTHWQANANRTGLFAGERGYAKEIWESMGCATLPAAIRGGRDM